MTINGTKSANTFSISAAAAAAAAAKMKVVRGVLRTANACLSRYSSHHRTFSALPNFAPDDKQSTNSFESAEDFERRIFGDSAGNRPSPNSFFRKLDDAEKSYDRSGLGSTFSSGNRSSILDGLDESFNTLSDGMDGKLKEAASYFQVDPDEVDKEDYAYRADMTFWPGNTYELKDLDLRKPGVRKPKKRDEFETTTEEVLRKADFRNVRFLANFITEAGILHKRSKTGISAKAQRKIAREIKTARAFGLMPFTTMGTKHFVFGRTMEDLDADYEYEIGLEAAGRCPASLLSKGFLVIPVVNWQKRNALSRQRVKNVDSASCCLLVECTKEASCYGVGVDLPRQQALAIRESSSAAKKGKISAPQ
ncbi:hypothetical protein KY290_005892 [Solanum tuberosum]|uniref:Small ribosomal subunit protein bS18c n=1 Tax=Solanum tuberosum TaxID=4113 RepID=A0ABQ7WFV2_SOLTU|nr:hypothetical protein KY284_006708 [Solanum tuberosum]KAH0723164.1 hypothetical protein KY289_006208 [Solanum tuberosum]KAH0753355.1 hypothetical protein KY285_006503 [Solanum tuberosum]KAH0779465.1 hypothetical protein KY290_005892 [Solanum tuberosum]